MGLSQNIQKQLGIPLLNIIKTYCTSHPDQKLSITNIFNAQQFLQLILKFTPQTVSVTGLQLSQSKDYANIWNILKQISAQLGIDSQKEQQPNTNFLMKTNINYQQQAILQPVWQCLRTMCGILFKIMLKNEIVLFILTQMQQKYQVQIKQYIELNQDIIPTNKNQAQSPLTKSLVKSNSSGFNTQPHNNYIAHSDQYLLQKIQQLQQSIVIKDQQLTKLKQKSNQSKQQLSTIKLILQEKQQQIVQLKRRVQMYSQAEVLFEEKDEEIQKLTQELTDTKLKLHIKSTQLSSQVSKQKTRVSQLQSQKNYLSSQLQRLTCRYQQSQLHKEQSETANKKVINNLKDKIKVLNDKISEQQKNIIQVLTQKQQRDKEYYELEKKIADGVVGTKGKFMSRFDQIKSSARKSSKLMDELGDLSRLLDSSSEEQMRYYEVLFGEMEGRCTGELCIALRSQYVKLFQQILTITKDTQLLSYMTPQSRLQCILKQLQKIHEHIQQNLKLKQKMILLQSESGKTQSNKQMLQQINKMKKKLLIMKRNMDDMEVKRKEELEVLVSAFCESVPFGNNKIGSK